MKTTLQSALVDNLNYLMTLCELGTQPEAARAGLRNLQQQYPETKLELLWEREEYDRSLHYDTLLCLPGQGTISLSFCPERIMPWPMRGVHRWNEEDLVRVNQTVFTVGQAIACLDFIWDEARIVNHLVNMCLIQEELDRNPIEFTEADLQIELNRFRKARKLYRAEDTHRWLEQNGMTHVQLERLLSDEVKVSKLREQIAASEIESYFSDYQDNFKTISLARLRFPDQNSAVNAYEQVISGQVGFYEIATSCLDLQNTPKPHLIPLFEVVQLHQMPPVLQSLEGIQLKPGRVLEPLEIEEIYTIFQIIDVKPACLDELTREAIQQILFDRWLNEKRNAAKIEWYWGSVLQTTPST
jgi:putative peptide maturation system protein